jgi:cbb3-type cytochrome oxidase subunit 3
MIDFLATHAAMIGLLFFFVFFCVMSAWVFRPGSKNTYTNHAHIPLEEND